MFPLRSAGQPIPRKDMGKRTTRTALQRGASGKERPPRQSGDEGEKEVIRLVRCPNCGKELMRLPPNYPMYDVQCTACSFRAQVKTNRCKPKNEIFGAGWEILNKVLKAGFMIPPLIVNFKWREEGSSKQSIVFFPFVPRRHIRKTVARPTRSARRPYAMFNYTRLGDLPHMILFERE